MSTNILLNEQGNEPLRFENEYFILKRQDISYSILLESGNKYEGEGYIIITSNRLVIFPKKQNTNFRAIEIPLNEIYSEEFKQPLFGKNYIKGKCRPYFQNQFGNFTFTIWVKGSRVGTLVGVFFTLIDSLRNNQGRNHNFEMMKNLKENNFNSIFAIDTDDESFIYPMQPPSVNIPKQNFQSVIINRPNNFNNNINRFNNIAQNNNNNLGNFSRLNEEVINNDINNRINMSNFNYKNPNDKFVYKDPGFVYKEPVYDINKVDEPYNNPHININSNDNINNHMNNNNNINNNAMYINNNANNINNNINRVNNIIRNNIIKKEDDDDEDLVNPYNIQKKDNQQNNIINNIINNNINNNIINNNANYNINNNDNYNNNQARMIINNNNIQNRYLNINQPSNNNNDMNLDNPYKIESSNINRNINNNSNIYNPNYNQGYPIQNNININQNINQNNNINKNQNNKININQNNNMNNQLDNPYGQIIGPKINNMNNKPNLNNNNKIMNFKKNNVKYRQLNEVILDDNDLNSKNVLNNNHFNESEMPFENKQDLSLISHTEDSLPDMSNIYPEF